eukprot:2731483-Lingulodinium_polyedra.AAC.1
MSAINSRAWVTLPASRSKYTYLTNFAVGQYRSLRGFSARSFLSLASDSVLRRYWKSSKARRSAATATVGSEKSRLQRHRGGSSLWWANDVVL